MKRVYALVSLFGVTVLLAASCGSKDGKSDAGSPTDAEKAKAAATAADTGAPVPGAGPSFSKITTSGYTVSWLAANDDTTLPAKLAYKLVSAATAAELDSIAKASAVTGSGVALDWTAAALSKDVSGVRGGVSRAYAVLVRDEAGKTALSPPQSVTTLDPGAPTIGTGLTFSNVTGSGFTVSWGAAVDPNGLPLSYKVAWARQASQVDSIAEIEALSGSASDWMTETTFDVPNLLFGADYAVAVLVRNDAGKTAIYSPAVRFTKTKRVFMSTAKITGNWSSLTKIGVDNSCQNDAKNTTGVGVNFKAMILVPGRSACTAANCSQSGLLEHSDWVFAPDMGYSRLDGTVVFKTDALGLVPQSNRYTPVEEVILGANLGWSGLASNWTALPNNQNCSGWTSAASASSRSDYYAYLETWPGSNGANCNTQNQYLCVEQ